MPCNRGIQGKGRNYGQVGQLQLKADQITMSPWTDKAFSRFWTVMGQMYGTAWYTTYGPEPSGDWKSELQTLSYECVDKTLKHFKSVPQMPDVVVFMAKAREAPTPTPRPEPIRITKTGSGRRSVFLPGESFSDYMDAMHKSGKTKAEFDRERLLANGWKA